MATSASDVEKVQSLLKGFRDAPVDTQGAPDSVLSVIYAYLMKIPSDGDGSLHWFCSRADEIATQAATFLIRLHAYNSSRVNAWKDRLGKCMSRCPACVEARELAKTRSRHTYFGAFSDDILQGFYRSVDEWEISLALSSLRDAGIDVESPDSGQTTLSDLPSGIVYLIFCNLAVFQDKRVQPLVMAKVPPAPILDWPPRVPPAGLLLLALCDRQNARTWARCQLQRYRVAPISSDRFIGSHEKIVYPIIAAVASTGHVDAPPSPASLTRVSLDSNSGNAGAAITFAFAEDADALWAGFAVVMRYLPAHVMHPSILCNIDIRHIIIGHLHDTGSRFIDVFRCLWYLTERCESLLWRDEGADYPQIVFDAVKDNRSFIEIFQNPAILASKPWVLAWFSRFMTTIWEMPLFGDVLAKVTDLMCEELQHDRFEGTRSETMTFVMKLLSTLFSKSADKEHLRQRTAISAVVDIHAHTLVSVAFSHNYGDSKWRDSRIAARGLVKDLLLKDVQDVAEAITSLCKFNRGSDASLPDPPASQQLIWKNAYQSLQPNDSDGVDLVLDVVASTAHMDLLSEKAFAASIQRSGKVGLILKNINKSLNSFRDGFLATISRYADYNTPSSILDLLRRQGVVQHIIALMLCPIDQAALAVQAIVGQAFDVDVRMDCFRALLENLPNTSLRGIVHFLEIFLHYIPVVPEACSLSKALVRCLTDVIEVLCSSPDGLLLKPGFLRGESGIGVSGDLLSLWRSMTRALALIFRLTPSWAPHFENEEMTVWMRDALIFGRDMLAQRRVIEAGALALYEKEQQSSRQPKKLSTKGKQMMDDLQEVLPELARWLRLTDEELLHQSFALLQSLLESFLETGVTPSEAGMKKLNKFVEDARRKDPKRPQTRLDTARLSQLEDTLAAFDDDDVQIIAYNPSSSKRGSGSNIAQGAGKVAGTSGMPKKRPVQDKKTRAPETISIVATNGSILPREPVKGTASASTSVTTKDHRPVQPRTISQSTATAKAPKFEGSSGKSNMSDSTSSEDDSEDDEEEAKEGGLVALGKLQRTPKIKRTVERRQVKMLDTTTNIKGSTNRLFDARREAQRTALRMKPDISSLHKALLSWNYEHDGPEPPMPNRGLALTRVPDRFTDYGQYRAIFEPLLLYECWAQLLQSKQESQEVFTCTVVSRGFIDDWLDLDISIADDVKKDWALTETDVVLLKQPEGKKCILGKTQSYKAQRYGIQATIRCYLPHAAMDPGLQINTSWCLSKVFSLSTLHREYAALMALPFYDFADSILQPRLPSKPLLDAREIQHTQAKYKVNEPQAVAILSSLKCDGFTLIQGPPGTGKTSTICGLVHAFLSRRPRPTTAIHAGRSAIPADKEPVKKVLLCAPSNAAVDEIAHRLKDGACGAGYAANPKVVRVGNDKNVNISVKDITLDYLVNQKLNEEGSMGAGRDTSNEIATLRAELEAVKRQKQQKQDELNAVHDNGARSRALEEEIRALNAKRLNLSQQFDRTKDQQKSDYRSLDATRRKCRTEVILAADVVCGTLSGVGHDILEQCDFDMVIIDEAAQAIELSSLIPLKYKSRRCVMVGDPQQLPPTVISQEASRYLYNQSLFVRLQKQKPESVHLLSIQYRMHPDISELPSRLFYQGQLSDGPDMAAKTRQPWHSHGKFGTYRFFSVGRGQEQEGGYRSLVNKAECQVAVTLYGRLRKEFSMFDFDYRVGVVSMYRAQIAEMRRAFISRFGSDIAGKVDFNTVDGFQGQEKDVIILSCVRAGPGLQSIGFLSDTRRMNVALTRAKSSLFVLGHAPTLERSDKTWRDIVSDARTRQRLAEASMAPESEALSSTNASRLGGCFIFYHPK
ncbi:hypothetical protein GLOTRDRAFT_42828 [Gloeophyllum trabeum ATCC 11539]|uniref:Helicase ATP-binding domain-containing protein n=1 Tax=Gloeophyllum trabeum (strain ATCC 11539 / FP-39264 / Madison 617) TaxID=670483 RepID=S7RNZ6_GLOTA|nr:uncharacterized protein GLOTRDRAFT_42828 [Gloeophyllum trabeum ATCC 11539]EPQ54489.1 hypothetical protein GLOTRDRAFT_42828 [Gloeophyllum trabeum ATCC 11539]